MTTQQYLQSVNNRAQHQHDLGYDTLASFPTHHVVTVFKEAIQHVLDAFPFDANAARIIAHDSKSWTQPELNEVRTKLLAKL